MGVAHSYCYELLRKVVFLYTVSDREADHAVMDWLLKYMHAMHLCRNTYHTRTIHTLTHKQTVTIF